MFFTNCKEWLNLSPELRKLVPIITNFLKIMLTLLDEAIAAAYESRGAQEAANRVWLALLKSPLFLPTDPNAPKDADEPFRPLYATIENQCFLAAFDTEARLLTWAGEHAEKMQHVTLSGRDIIAGMGEDVFLALNIGTPYYKEFSPDEIKHLKKIVAKIAALKTA